MHQRTLNKEAKTHAVQDEYKRKEELIQRAKAEWAKKNLPADKKTASGDGNQYSKPPLFSLNYISVVLAWLLTFYKTH